MRRCRAWRAKKRSFAGRTPQTSYPRRRNATRNRDKTRTGRLERVFHIHPAFICWIPPFESSPRVSLQLIPGGTISSQNDRRRAAAKFPRGQSGLGKAPPKFRSSHQRRELPRQTLTQEVIYIISRVRRLDMIAPKEMPPVLREGISKNVDGLRNVTAKDIPCSHWSTKEMRPNAQNPPSPERKGLPLGFGFPTVVLLFSSRAYPRRTGLLAARGATPRSEFAERGDGCELESLPLPSIVPGIKTSSPFAGRPVFPSFAATALRKTGVPHKEERRNRSI